jgi:FkbM family methyltransferase
MLRARWMKEYNTDIVLDVGASVGTYVDDLRSYGYQGPVISFEPVKEVYEILKGHAKNDPNWQVRQMACGPQNTRTRINVSSNTVSSSLLPMLDTHATAAPESRYIRQEEVEVIALDSLLGTTIKTTDRVWLKMDAQGYEFSILEGCVRLRPQIVGMDIELSVVPLYEGSPLLAEALTRLERMGFRTGILSDGFFDPQTKMALQVDGIFLRDKANALAAAAPAA